MAYMWKYLKKGTHQHLFFRSNSQKPSCGLVKPNFLWLSDEEGLKTLPRCIDCSLSVLR